MRPSAELRGTFRRAWRSAALRERLRPYRSHIACAAGALRLGLRGHLRHGAAQRERSQATYECEGDADPGGERAVPALEAEGVIERQRPGPREGDCKSGDPVCEWHLVAAVTCEKALVEGHGQKRDQHGRPG